MRIHRALAIAVSLTSTAGTAGAQQAAQQPAPQSPPPAAQPSAPPTPTLGANDASVSRPGGLPAGYHLVWADEFDRGPSIDPAKWAFDTSRNKAGWYNDEKQYYAADRPANLRIENGALVIEARREDLSAAPPRDWGGQAYTSGKIQTLGKARWTYGFFEVRAKLACGGGTWPAIWMLGDNGLPWPTNGEIDIMEHVGWNQGTIYGTIHTAANNHAEHTQKGAEIKLADVCGQWHRYQLHWTADQLEIGVDDRTFMAFANDRRGDPRTWPFNGPQYLILNLAIGGWGGQQGGIDDTALPARFAVDYVRVWQR